MEQLVSILYHLTSALLYPVVIILFILLVWTLFQVGGFLREWVDRKKKTKNLNSFLQAAESGGSGAPGAKHLFFQHIDYPSLVARFAKRAAPCKESPDELDRIISEIEIEGSENCSRMNLWIRIGPMLGLMGTLIPMGPALVGLSSADIEVMAGNLVVAFSTTVIGLLIGALCAVISVTRRHWYIRDLSIIEHIVDTRFAEKSV